MRILLINTAGAEGSVALADTDLAPAVVVTEVMPGRTSSERLIPAVRRLMDEQAWTLKELAAVVVVHGPGSFTGVRVGLSAAKGLSEAAGVPLIAVSRLALLASRLDGENGPISAVLDAGRGEFYFGQYVGQHCLREGLAGAENLRAEIAGAAAVIVCEANVAEALAGIGVRMVAEPTAGDALPLALRGVVAGDFDDTASLDANYLRRTDMEIFAKPAAGRAVK